MKKDVTIAAYYFPNFHPDPRNEKLYGPGWSEWNLVKAALPKFEGHAQPKVPQWGYEDESDPTVMAKKLRQAADHGIDHFIFDWYYYDDGPFLERALDRGYLGVSKPPVGFAVMWANHTWRDIFPEKLSTRLRQKANAGVGDLSDTASVLYPGEVTWNTFDRVVGLCIEKYFKHPSYWKIDGAPWFGIYDFAALLKGLGGVEGTAEALDSFRAKVMEAGFPDLFLVAEPWRLGEADKHLERFGVRAVSRYHWAVSGEEEFPRANYAKGIEVAKKNWRQYASKYKKAFIPDVTAGYDVSPRACQSDQYINAGYPYRFLYSNFGPELFKEALVAVKTFMAENPENRRILTICAWNEWTEGSCLEPDQFYGMRLLEAIREVFSSR